MQTSPYINFAHAHPYPAGFAVVSTLYERYNKLRKTRIYNAIRDDIIPNCGYQSDIADYQNKEAREKWGKA